MLIKIAGTEININHNAVEIYLSGCKNHSCEGCHNPELWDFSVGEEWRAALPGVLKTITNMNSIGLLSFVWILGGEPLDNPYQQLISLIKEIRLVVTTNIVLWTHYSSIPEDILPHINYAKIGPYVAGGEPYTEPLLGITLANKEQRVIAM